MRTIKITEQQLKEAEQFSFLTTDNDTPHYDGQTHISVGGKEDDDTNSKPIDGDDIGNTISAQSYNRNYDRSYGIVGSPRLYNNYFVENKDSDRNGIDDFYEKPELDSKSGNDIVQIPQGVERKINILLSDMKKLSPKQQAVALDKILEALDLSSLPPSYLKNLRLDIQ